jgi:hypothetical protein
MEYVEMVKKVKIILSKITEICRGLGGTKVLLQKGIVIT